MADASQRLRRLIDTKLLITSVVRGTQKGDSHGGVYLLDLKRRDVIEVIDWDTADIDWHGRGADRGLRGIAFDGDTVYIAASDELFAYSPTFEKKGSWRSPFLKHCHEISIQDRTLFLTSAGYDSILGFDLDKQEFNWAMHVRSADFRFNPVRFDPMGNDGPIMMNKMHLNTVFCNEHGMYISGLRSGGMLHFNGADINMSVQLPEGTHNAQPFRDGVLFNDTEANALRYTGRGEGEEDRAFQVPEFQVGDLQEWDPSRNPLARPRFARGLCVLNERIVAGGSSPSTVSLYDLAGNSKLGHITLTTDVRNAVHGLAVWPY